MRDEIYWIWLQRALGVGAHQSEAVLRSCEHAREVYERTSYPDEWMLTATQRRRLADRSLKAAIKEWEALEKCGAWLMTPAHPLYTVLFEGMYAPPVCLYAKGNGAMEDDRPRVAVVGTRYHDENGRRVTRQLAAGLAAGGAIVVSGGATGLDCEALDAALDEHGVCISFQACGINVEYPQATAPMRKRLLQNGGLLLSEFSLGAPAYRNHFRIRNRLISAAANGTLVTQAPFGSGALITARWAGEQGKDVFAVPGAVGVPCCEGSNELLKDGAQIVTNAADILAVYLSRYPFAVHVDKAAAAEARALSVRLADPFEPAAEAVAESPAVTQRVAEPSAPSTMQPAPCSDDVGEDVKRVYASLEQEPKTVTELARDLALTPSQVLSALTELELYGTVTCKAGQVYALSDLHT